MKKSSILLVLLYFSFLIFLFQTGKKHFEEGKNQPVQNSLNRHLELSQIKNGVTVEYKVFIDSIYTGDQTPVWITGEQFFKGVVGKDLNIGPNGLPVIGAFPDHVTLNFRRNQDDMKLDIPVTKPIMTAIAGKVGDRNIIWLIAEMQKKSADRISVVATPATREEIKKINAI